MGEGFVGIDADGLGDGADEAAGVDFAGEVVVAALFEALELGEGDTGGASDPVDGQSALDPGPSEADADGFHQDLRRLGGHRRA